MDFIKKHKKDIAGYFLAALIIIEILFLFSPVFFGVFRGTYYGDGVNIKFSENTYSINGQKKGFYTYSNSVPAYLDEYGVAAVYLDAGYLLCIKSPFTICDVDSGEKLVCTAAIIYQIAIAAAFCIAIYFAYVQKRQT